PGAGSAGWLSGTTLRQLRACLARPTRSPADRSPGRLPGLRPVPRERALLPARYRLSGERQDRLGSAPSRGPEAPPQAATQALGASIAWASRLADFDDELLHRQASLIPELLISFQGFPAVLRVAAILVELIQAIVRLTEIGARLDQRLQLARGCRRFSLLQK